jgi:hypothetical protein
MVPGPTQELLLVAYKRFNSRDLDGVLALMHPDVDWPNGWEGGRVQGHDGVRQYWTRLWAVLSPYVDPVRFETCDRGGTAVTVRQIVRDMTGALLADSLVKHVYEFEEGLIRRMEIRSVDDEGNSV